MTDDHFARGRVSVIVPTCNSDQTISACLAAVRSQTFHDVELIVVDNGSTDGTLVEAGRLADKVISAGPERSAQRNRGARAASGEYLVFIDSDMAMTTTVAEEVQASFASSPTFAALVLPELSQGEGFWARCRALEKQLYLGDPDIEAARAFRTELFMAIGGYDEELTGPEDWDLAERVTSAGGTIGPITAVVTHLEGWPTLRRILGKKLYYGRTMARYARKHPGRALKKVLRLHLLRHWRLMLRQPATAAGLLSLKVLEGIAGLLGVIVSAAPRLPGPALRGR